jgi:uncharacterized protein involved in outer membrane biogenesis
MKRRWKILIGIGIALVVLLVAVFFSINVIAKTAIEKGGTIVLGTATSVGSVTLSVFGGSAEVKNLAIANPKGYGDGNVLELGRAYVRLKPASLLSDVIEVEEIAIEAPVIKLRQQGLKSNLGALLDSLDSGSPEKKSAESKSKKFQVGVIKLTDARMEYSLMGAPSAKMPLPDITINQISNGDNTAVTIGSVIKQVVVAMAQAAARTGGKIVPADVSGALGHVFSGAKDGIGKTVQGAEGAAKGIGSLFKKIGGGSNEPAPATGK